MPGIEDKLPVLGHATHRGGDLYLPGVDAVSAKKSYMAGRSGRLMDRRLVTTAMGISSLLSRSKAFVTI